MNMQVINCMSATQKSSGRGVFGAKDWLAWAGEAPRRISSGLLWWWRALNEESSEQGVKVEGFWTTRGGIQLRMFMRYMQWVN